MSETRTLFLLLAQYNTALLDFNEVCRIIGIKPSTGRNWKSADKFPIRLLPSGQARLQDVADWIDQQVSAA